MEDEEITLCNFCGDLLSLKNLEAFPLALLGKRQSGEWVSVIELCREVGIKSEEIKDALFVSWLPDPGGNEAYVVVVFYDESGWSMTAFYNRQRLTSLASPNELEPVGLVTTGKR